MSDPMIITLISVGVTFLFMLGVPVFLVIGYWVLGMSFLLAMPLDNIGAALADVFTDGFALLAMPLFILTGDRHFAGVLHGELGSRPVVELMSSGLTHAVLPFFKPFYRRIHGKEQRFFRKNYAQVKVDWSRPEQPRVRFEAIDRKGRTRVLAEF